MITKDGKGKKQEVLPELHEYRSTKNTRIYGGNGAIYMLIQQLTNLVGERDYHNYSYHGMRGYFDLFETINFKCVIQCRNVRDASIVFYHRAGTPVCITDA